MKRRDLLTKIFPLAGAILAIPSIIGGGLSLWTEQGKDSVILASYGHTNIMLQDGVVILPKEPETYDTVYEIFIDKERMPEMRGNGALIEGTEDQYFFRSSGNYTIQYLGPFYGWSIT